MTDLEFEQQVPVEETTVAPKKRGGRKPKAEKTDEPPKQKGKNYWIAALKEYNKDKDFIVYKTGTKEHGEVVELMNEMKKRDGVITE
jgi:hypothetical protein